MSQAEEVPPLPAAAEGILHERGSAEIRWTTVNMAEVQPGVLTPLNWSFWRDPCETGVRGGFADIGVLPKTDIPPPPGIDTRIGAVFYGRFAANLSFLCDISDRMPGGSSEALEQQIFGSVDRTVERHLTRSRYGAVAVKLPVSAARAGGRTLAIRRETGAWWRDCIAWPDGPPLERVADAQRRLRRAMRMHMTATLFAQGAFDALCRLTASAGLTGLERHLCAGFGGLEETQISEDLWSVSRGTLSMEFYLERHGYHGPSEGELSSRVWREDQTQLLAMCESYRRMPESQSPANQARLQAQKRARAMTTLADALPRAKRPFAEVLLRAAAHFLPMREVGKASFLMSIDVARAAARELGADLAERGVLDEPEDVFYLLLPELATGPGTEARPLVKERRAIREHFATLSLPERWTGDPVPVREIAETETGAPVSGMPVSSGIAEGRARVVLDPNDAEPLEPGDILVCETTDPSWVVLFHLSGAVVIDVGGPLSHGAIVARELGLPAVINTRNGTRAIPDGAHVRVDGSAGTVTVLNPPNQSVVTEGVSNAD